MEPDLISISPPSDSKSQIKSARGKFAAMAASYSLGSLNDNFYKQAVMVMAVAMGREELQGRATVFYTLPFLIFAAYAGWLSDRFSKRNVVIAAKVLELVAMLFGAVGICLASWDLILVMIFLMGLQATIFSPAINGSIPELYPAWHVTQANALMKMATTTAILLGVAGASFVMGLHSPGPLDVPMGRWVVAIGVVVMALAGLGVSFGVPRRPAADPRAKAALLGPIDTVCELGRTLRDPLLAAVIAIDSYVWFLGALIAMLINTMGLSQFKYGEMQTGGLVFAELVGIAMGGLLAGKVASGPRWYRWLGPAAIAMALCMIALVIPPYVPTAWQYPMLLALLAGTGLFGGLMLIPLESFIQIRPAPERKGTIIAAANFAAFGGILLSGPQANMFHAFHSLPTISLAVTGIVTAAVGAALLCTLTFRSDE